MRFHFHRAVAATVKAEWQTVENRETLVNPMQRPVSWEPSCAREARHWEQQVQRFLFSSRNCPVSSRFLDDSSPDDGVRRVMLVMLNETQLKHRAAGPKNE